MAHGVSKAAHIAIRITLFKNWYKLIFPFNRMVSKQQRLHLRNGVVAEVGDIYSSDVSVLMEVFAKNVYHLERLSLPEEAVIIDLGANIGAFSLAAKHQFPRATIIAYEPFPRNFELLRCNIPFAHIEQKAVTGLGGVARIEAEGAPTALRLISEGGVPVESVSLGEALKDFPIVHLLKVDIEGAEWDVFTHAVSQTMNKIQNILMEIHDPEKISWFENYFTSHGFEYEWLPSKILHARKTT